jgi:small subunit ribosomal protein S4
MGDPKIIKRKFEYPPHPWQKSRIEEEKGLIKEYGLKNKTEIWKMSSKAKNFSNQAKKLTASESGQSKKETEQLLARLSRLGLLPMGASIDDVLGLTVKDLLERRLQTIVFKKGLAKSISQARQFITHQHIALDNKIITSPSYMVDAAEEAKVSFVQKSALADPEHPERVVEKPKPQPKKPEAKEEEPKSSDKPEQEKKEEKKKGKPKSSAKAVKEKKEAKPEEKKEDKPEAKEKLESEIPNSRNKVSRKAEE